MPGSTPSFSAAFAAGIAPSNAVVPPVAYFRATGSVQQQITSGQNELRSLVCLPVTGSPALVPTSMRHVRFGRAYEARFKKEAQSFRLLARFLAGEKEVASPGRPAPLVNVIEDLETDAKNVIVDSKTLW